MSGKNSAAQKPNVNPGPAAAKKGGKKPVAAKEKQRAVAFVNWRIPHPTKPDESLLRSNRGFSLFDNEHTTVEEKALVELAKKHGGTAIVQAEFRIIIAQEKPESIDVSDIPVLNKKS